MTKRFRNVAYIIMSTVLLMTSKLGLLQIVMAGDSGQDCDCEDKCSHGYHTFDDYYLCSAGGSKNGKKYYYIDTSTFQSADSQYVLAGISEWMTIDYIKNYIDLTRTYNQSNAQITIKKSSLSFGINGISAIYVNPNDSAYGVPDNNYSKVVITIEESLGTSQHRLVSMHEMGHAMGLSHALCQEYNSVMWPASDFMSISVTSFDKSNLRHIYC